MHLCRNKQLNIRKLLRGVAIVGLLILAVSFGSLVATVDYGHYFNFVEYVIQVVFFLPANKARSLIYKYK